MFVFMYSTDDDLLSHEKLYKTEGRIYAVRRGAFCWLDDSQIIVLSGFPSDKNSIILNTVGFYEVTTYFNTVEYRCEHKAQCH